MSVLVTGGAGYIGSHTCVTLLESGYEVVVLDNLSNSSKEAINRVEKITGKTIKLYEGDVLDRDFIRTIFANEEIEFCIHFAGLKAPAESVAKPMEYYYSNLNGLMTLTEVMKEHDCRNLIFSSSAAVYGVADEVPVTEKCRKNDCSTPYGWTKSMSEQILMDLQKSDKTWNIVILRYFNPIGAHESGLIGESPDSIPNNLMPYITKVAVGELDNLNVFGNDYDTVDGTGVRDYIHVMDLAKAHVYAAKKFADTADCRVYNVGTGKGYSVLEVVDAFVKATGVEVPYVIRERRPGDVAISYCSPAKAYEELGWSAKHDLVKMCEDSWKWQKNNPKGYK